MRKEWGGLPPAVHDLLLQFSNEHCRLNRACVLRWSRLWGILCCSVVKHFHLIRLIQWLVLRASRVAVHMGYYLRSLSEAVLAGCIFVWCVLWIGRSRVTGGISWACWTAKGLFGCNQIKPRLSKYRFTSSHTKREASYSLSRVKKGVKERENHLNSQRYGYSDQLVCLVS